MKAIIINDNDARALIDQLKLESFQNQKRFGGPLSEKVSQEIYNEVLKDVHAQFHFKVSRWFQDQGASLIR